MGGWIDFGRNDSLPARDRQRAACARRMPIDGEGNHAGKDHQERKEDFRDRRDEWSTAGRGHVFRSHRALDDEEVGAPIAERQHEAESHRQPEPFHADRILR